MSKPIKPSDVGAEKLKHIPPSVVDVWNKHIALRYVSGKATIYQKDVVTDLEAAGWTTREIYDQGFLDIEELYRNEGWSVYYDKPAYNESYESHFVFKVK